jgi:hypothetical protein
MMGIPKKRRVKSQSIDEGLLECSELIETRWTKEKRMIITLRMKMVPCLKAITSQDNPWMLERHLSRTRMT